jgi:hypothetical protein
MPDYRPLGPQSSTKQGHQLIGLEFEVPLLTILIFIVVSYEELAASCASEMSADSRTRL